MAAVKVIRFLRRLLDVELTNPQDGDRLEFDAVDEKWKNVPPVAVGPHADSHENGGGDEIDVAGLSGLLADPQTPLSHNHAGEDITSGTVADARIASTIARDSEVTAAIAASEAGQVRDGDAAGGVLSGTYPNPGFAADMATQAELDAHVNDASDAHDASAISIADAANDFTATDVEGALAELQSDHEADAQALADHIADASAAHAASAISVNSATLSGTGTDVQASLEELDNLLDDHSSRHENGGADEISLAGLAGTPTELTNHLNDASDAHDASAISFSPAGTIAATDVQAAIEEVAAEAGGGGAPADADYLVGTAQGGLSAEIVVGTSPGGELGGTWASPTVDATHSGSSHAGVQAAAEATAAAALAAHTGDTSDAHDASAISVDSTALSGTGTDVQASLEEIDNLLDDHSARHENGGADEISLAGLSGTSEALQAHLDDASDAHDASAISVVSTTLSGTGTDVQAVFEEIDNLLDDHSSRHENGGADEISIAGLDGTPTELTNHLNDTSDAHDASAISVADAKGNFAATEVEAALAELATFRVQLKVIADTTVLTTGDGKTSFWISPELDGCDLIAARAAVVGSSSSGTPTVQLRRVRGGSPVDMLSTAITIDANELDSTSAATPPAINTSNDDVDTGDRIFVDVDVAGTGTDGLDVEMVFRRP